MLRKLPGALGALLLLSIPVHADQLNLTLDMSPPTQPGGVYQPNLCTNSDGSGSCVIFTGTITTDGLQNYYLDALFLTMNSSNPDGGADVFDNTPQAASFGNAFFLNATSNSGTLGPLNPASDPNTYTGGLFEVDVEPAAAYGDYFGTATLDFTDDLDCTDPTNPCTVSAGFEVMVVPEPAAWLLAATGLAALAFVRQSLTPKAQ